MGKRSVSVHLTRTVSLQVPCRLWNPPRNSNFLWGFGLCGIVEHKQRGHRQKCCQQMFITIRWTSDNVVVVLNHLMPFHVSDWPISTLPAHHPIRGSRLSCLIRMQEFPQKKYAAVAWKVATSGHRMWWISCLSDFWEIGNDPPEGSVS